MQGVASVSVNIANRYKRYQQTTVSWKARTGYDDYGKPEHPTTGTDITAREVKKTKVVKNTQGKEQVATTVYMVSDNVNAEDLIDDKMVLAVEDATPFDNVTAGKLVYL